VQYERLQELHAKQAGEPGGGAETVIKPDGGAAEPA